MRRNVIRSLTICEFCQERLGSRTRFDGVIVMTTPEKPNWNARLCVSEQGNGCRSVAWNIGVSPMEFNGSIMVNHRLALKWPLQCLYNIALVRSECSRRNFFLNQGGA